jgi:hypothetical protein
VASSNPPHVLREYALLADGERGALIGPRGDIGWLCFPRWDSDGVLSALLGGPGAYAVTPRARFVWGGAYDRGLIWRSRWVCDDGAIVECREALALPATPTRAVLLRRILATSGDAGVRVGLDLRPGFGSTALEDPRRDDGGRWTLRGPALHASWTGAGGARVVEGRLELELDVPAGSHHDLVLALDREEGAPPADADALWSATEAAWAAAVPGLEATIAPRDARHACAVLHGLTSSGGGMVAAATASLPERARQGRNYDYRFVWIRDQCYAGQAAAAAGHPALLDAAVRFVSERILEHGPELAPAYTTAAEPVPEQRRVGLPGYPGGGDVVGNHVRSQFQLDAFGEALLLFAAAERSDRLSAEATLAAERAFEAIDERWRGPDAGIWELEPARWTHSRLVCAAGLRAFPGRDAPERRLALADALVAEAAAHGLHPTGRWQRAFDDDRVDASLLLGALRGATPPDDPRATATLAAVEAELTQDGFCYRFRPDERPLGQAEGAFLLCGFWLALAHDQRGDPVRATRWFERNRAACGPPGLLCEEFDVVQRQLRGNLPQAFVHALLLECAATLRG